MKWVKIGRKVGTEGTTVIYQAEGTRITIESRKRHIEHANGVGTWDHTSYWVRNDGVDIKELYRLTDAKEYAEGLL